MAELLFSTGSLYPLDIAHCFALAAETGVDGVEVLGDQRWSTRDAVYLQALSDRYELPIRVVHTPFTFTLPGWEAKTALRIIEQTITLAEAVGAQSIVVHLPDRTGHLLVYTQPGRVVVPWVRNPFAEVKRWMESGAMAERQARTSVRLAVENMPNRATRFFGRVNSSHWNTIEEWASVHEWLTLDTTHWGTKGIDPVEAYQAAGQRVTHVHLSNYDGSTRHGTEHRLPHHGDLDLARFLQTLAANGFAGTISLELHPDALHFTDEDQLRRLLAESVSFCREHLR